MGLTLTVELRISIIFVNSVAVKFVCSLADLRQNEVRYLANMLECKGQSPDKALEATPKRYFRASCFKVGYLIYEAA